MRTCQNNGQNKIQKLCWDDAAGQNDQSLAGQLQEGCPSFFKEDDKTYYAANAELRRAQTLQGGARQDVTRAALEKLVRVWHPALTCPGRVCLGPACCCQHPTAIHSCMLRYGSE